MSVVLSNRTKFCFCLHGPFKMYKVLVSLVWPPGLGGVECPEYHVLLLSSGTAFSQALSGRVERSGKIFGSRLSGTAGALFKQKHNFNTEALGNLVVGRFGTLGHKMTKWPKEDKTGCG